MGTVDLHKLGFCGEMLRLLPPARHQRLTKTLPDKKQDIGAGARAIVAEAWLETLVTLFA